MHPPFTSEDRTRHVPRGLKQYTWTLDDLAWLVGLHSGTVRRHIRQGKLDPKDLASVVDYVKDQHVKRKWAGM